MTADSGPESGQEQAPTPVGMDNGATREATAALSPRAKAAMLLLLGVLVGAVGYRLLADSPGYSEPSPVVVKTARPLIRSGNRVSLPEGSPLRAALTISPVAAKEMKRDLVLPAAVEANPAHLIKVDPPVAGRVTQLKVELGQRVKAGQPLVVIDSPDLGTAYSDYDRAKSLLALALKTRTRETELAKIGGAALKELQQAETDYVTAQAEYQRAMARLKQIGVDPDAPAKSEIVTVAAPMDGSVIDLSVAPGEYWNDPTAAMMTVADLNTVWVTASVPEKDLSLVSTGQVVNVVLAAYPGQVLHGNVLFVSDVLDPQTRRTKVSIAFKNPDMRMRPGMFANVTFFAPAESFPVVPTSALVLKDNETQVFVETSPWIFEAHDVDIAFQQGGEAVLSGGIKVGDRVVTRGGVLLGD